MVGKTYPWQGFDFIPSGCLLEQMVDLSADMGFAYERSTKFYKDFHTHDRLMLIFPRGTSAMDVRTKSPEHVYHVNYQSILFVPAHLVHDDEGASSIYDTMAFYPSKSLLEATAKKLNISNEDLKRVENECIKIQRTDRINRLVQAYFYERVLCKDSLDMDALTFLGRRILEVSLAILFLKDVQDDPTKPTEIVKESVTARALRFIEANLFEPIDVPAIAQHAHASVSTLMRHFKTDVGATPHLYIKNRRLEEAMFLLKTGSHPIGDVALLVGYENFGAFSEAFKEKYGESPSFYRKSSSF